MLCVPQLNTKPEERLYNIEGIVLLRKVRKSLGVVL